MGTFGGAGAGVGFLAGTITAVILALKGFDVGPALGSMFGISAGCGFVAGLATYAVIKVREHQNTPKEPKTSEDCVILKKPVSEYSDSEGNIYIRDENL